MKFGVVGCQHFHIKMFIDEMLALGHEFVGVYDDLDSELATQYIETYGVPRLQSLDDMVHIGVDVIGNAARNDHKIDVIEWGEQHGIHVMTDKPIVINEEGLERYRNVLERDRIKTSMMLTGRFSPSLYTLKKMIEQDLLGEVLDMTYLKPHKLSIHDRPDWFFDKSKNGGLIIDLLIHDVDSARWLTGKGIVDYHGWLIKNMLFEYGDFYDVAQMNLILEDCVNVTMKTDWLMPEAFEMWGDGRVFVTGTKGRVEIRSAGDVLGETGPFLTLTTHQNKTTRWEVERPPVTLSEDFLNQIEGKPHLLTAKEIFESNAAVIQMDAKCVTKVRQKGCL